MKICNKCGIEKELTEFHKRPDSKDGYRNNCKICRKNADNIYYTLNKEKICKINKNRQKVNKEKYKITRRKWIERNKEILNIKRNERRKKQNINDNLCKIKSVIRSTILINIKKNGYSKKSKTCTILGCSFEEFKVYIENKFEYWMTWDNHGVYTGNYNETWQYDHIIPISLALNEDEIIKLNNYTNFQPLCSKKNLEKSNFIINSI